MAETLFWAAGLATNVPHLCVLELCRLYPQGQPAKVIPACERRGSLQLQKATRLCISAHVPIAVCLTYVPQKAGESILSRYTVECCVTG